MSKNIKLSHCVAFDEESHPHQIVEFKYPDDDELPKDSDSISAARLLHHLLVMGNGSPRETLVWIAVFLFAMGLHPEQGTSGKEIAMRCGITKAEWFRRVTKLRRVFKARGLVLPKIQGEWSNAARLSQSNSAIVRWRKKSGKPLIIISDMESKLRWIAENVEKIYPEQMSPAMRRELKVKLLPIRKLIQKL